MSRFAVTTAVAGALVLPLTGCADLGGHALNRGSPARPSQVLAEAVSKSANADTFRQRLTSEVDMTLDGKKVQTTMVMDAKVRMKPEIAMVGTMTTTMTPAPEGLPPGNDQPTELIMIGDSYYMKSPTSQRATGKPWARVSFGDGKPSGKDGPVEPLKQTQPSSPSEQATLLKDAKDLREVGREMVDGIQTTRYAGQVSMGDGDTGFIELWIGDDGLPRKQTSKMTSSGDGDTVNATTLFSEYHRPVEINPPPASEVGTLD